MNKSSIFLKAIIFLVTASMLLTPFTAKADQSLPSLTNDSSVQAPADPQTPPADSNPTGSVDPNATPAPDQTPAPGTDPTPTVQPPTDTTPPDVVPPPKDQNNLTPLTTGGSGSQVGFDIPTRPKASVDQSSGALTYAYPINLPDGRNGMTPKLSLNYDSRKSTQPDSITGLGWSVSIPYIQREPIKGTQNLFSSAFFSSSESGNLIATTDTTSSQYTVYRPESDSGDYIKYTFNSDGSWTVRGKDGLTYTYGATASSRQDNPTDATKIYKWMLTKIADLHGNEIQYTYIKDSGQIYPNQILYTYNVSSPAVNTVSFVYTTPTSNYGTTVYNDGFAVTTLKYLSTINVATTTNGQTGTHTYTLNMTDATNLKQKLLSSITHTFDNPQIAANDVFNDTTSYSYSTKTPGWQIGTHSLASIDSYFLNYYHDSATGTQYIYPADFDGNGYQDLLFSYPTGQTGNNKLMLNNGTTFVDSTTAWNVPATGPAFQYYYAVDLNGDHLPDLVQKAGGAPYMNTGSGFTVDNSGHWDLNTYLLNSNGNCSINAGDIDTFGSPTFLFDINNDGKNDLVRFGSNSQLAVFLNNGNGYTASSNYTFTIKPGSGNDFDSICNSLSNPPKNFQTMIDVNGDGLLDYVNYYLGTYLNTGTGFAYSSAYTILPGLAGQSGLTDINGDGLIDYIIFVPNDQQTIPDHTETYLNTGAGFTLINDGIHTGPWATNALSYSSHNNVTWGQLMDINADGFPDVIGADNGGTRGKIRAFNDSVSSWVSNPNQGDNWVTAITPFWGVYQDYNNDGVLDFMTPWSNWNNVTQPERVFMGNPSVPNKLSAITSPFGATTNITYGTASTNLSDTNPSPMSVVKKVAIQNLGQGQPDMVTQYDYVGGAYVVDPATGQKRFAGFQNVNATESGADLNPIRTTQTYFMQDNGSDSTTNEPPDNNLALIGKPYYSITKNPTGTLKKENWNKYGAYTLVTEPVVGRLSQFVYPTQSVSRTTEPGAVTGTAETYTFDTNIGEQTQLQNLGFVTVANDGTYTDVAGDTRYQFTSYASNAGGTIVKPATKEIRTTPAKSGIVAHTEDYYDSQSLGTIGSFGDLSKESKWVSGNGAVVANTNYTYDAYGNVLTMTNPRNYATTYTYDATQTQVATETNASNQVTTYTYMVTLPQTVVDSNGRTTTYGYTSLGLLYSTTVQNTGGTQRTRQQLGQQTAGVWDIESYSQVINTNIEDQTEQSFDGLGRPVRLMRQDRNDTTGTVVGDYIKEVRSYDALGRQVTTSAPYGNASSDFVSLFSITLPANLISTTSYDVFDRPTSVVNALGATTNSYTGVETTTTDANNHIKKTSTDAYGNLVQVKEINGASTYITNYTYDQRNLLTNITDALGNVRNFTYNNAGWMTSSEDLHAIGDAVFGSTSWTYDLNGNKLVETQPNATTVTRVYDNLDRVSSLDGSSTLGTDYSYTYDTCTNGKGHLCSVTGILPNNVTLNKSYVYGISGVPTSETLTTLGNAYTTSYLYTLTDQVSKITYPNGTIVRYVFGEWGLPATVYTTLPGGAEAIYATQTYHHTLKPDTLAITNGPTITHVYDNNKLYRESSMSAVKTGTTLQSYAYTYDNVNNITQIVEPGLTKGFSYDDLNRLTQGIYTPTKGAVTTYSYGYDAIGNITSMNGQAYTYAGTRKTNPHAVTSIGTNNYNYDDNGNMATAPNQTFTFNWQNQPSRVVVGGTTNIDSYYDENGQRFIYQTPSSTEVQAQSDYLVRGGTPEVSVKIGGNEIGTISGTNIYSSITDQLGTPVKQVSSAGTIAEAVTYDPFGKVLTQTGIINTKDGYTGHQEDVDTGLVYAQARYYNPGIGRFASEDPAFITLGDQAETYAATGLPLQIVLADPQGLNSYSYVKNNPIILTDPDGLFWNELKSFFAGAGNAIGSNNLLGFGRQAPANSYYQTGQKVGDVTSLLQGSYETAVGIVSTIGGAAGGVAASPTGVGALAGVGVSAAGLAATAHGTGVAGTAMLSLMNGNGIVSNGNNWGNPRSLNSHFIEHGADFGATSAQDYANKANDFKTYAEKNKAVQMYRSKDGVVRYYDKQSNTFGVYNKNGTTATFFKPESGTRYIHNQLTKGELGGFIRR